MKNEVLLIKLFIKYFLFKEILSIKITDEMKNLQNTHQEAIKSVKDKKEAIFYLITLEKKLDESKVKKTIQIL